MNKVNLLLLLILGIGIVCGCNFSSEVGVHNKNSNRRNPKVLTASKKNQQPTNSKTASQEETDEVNESDDSSVFSESDDSSESNDKNTRPNKSVDETEKPSDESDSADEMEKSSDESDAAAEIGDISQLVGKWFSGRSGSTTTTTTGVYVGSNGSRFTYEFSPDGTVEYTGIMNIMSGGCNMQIFKSSEGHASLNGDALTINWEPASFSRDDSCSRSQNYKKTLPAETETFTVNFKESGSQEQLCLKDKDETCFSRAE